MKYLKKYEGKLKTIDFKDLDNWDIKSKNDKDKYSGTKDFDLNLGQKTLDVLSEYRLGILSINPGDFLTRMEIVLPPEMNFKEYRITLGVKLTFDNFLENNEIDDSDELSDKELIEWETKYDNDEIINIDHYNLSFSVFFPVGVKNFEASALSEASKYLKLLNDSFPDIIKDGYAEDDVLNRNVNGYKTFINNKGIKITNNNIEMVSTVNYRIYKDFKFFAELKDVCKDYDIDYRDLINDWIKII
jgi:hypothetical protein